MRGIERVRGRNEGAATVAGVRATVVTQGERRRALVRFAVPATAVAVGAR
jgi:hypothetical protein